jgi:histidine triad (HIT) family protein
MNGDDLMNDFQQNDCLFCCIARGEVEAHKIYESDDVLAFLDIHPIRMGHVQIIPRRHFAYYDDLPADIASEIMRVGQLLAPILREKFQVRRVAFLFTGGDIPHAHAHVVPMVGEDDITSSQYIVEKNITFKCTPRAADAELSEVAFYLSGKLQTVRTLQTHQMHQTVNRAAVITEEPVFVRYDESEAEQLAQWIASENWPFHGSKSPSLEKVRKWIADGSYSGEDNQTFWIRLNGYAEPVGVICLHELSDETPIFDLRLKSAVRNRGLGRQVINWLTHYVFTQTDKRRIEGHTRVDNIAMHSVFKACNWVKEAHYRQAWPDFEGNYFDAVTYAVLKTDWENGIVTPVEWESC